VANVCRTSIVGDAWARGQALTVHGWIYGIHDGLLRDLGFTATSLGQAASGYRRALAKL
jgi:carbonic anhydrase